MPSKSFTCCNFSSKELYLGFASSIQKSNKQKSFGEILHNLKRKGVHHKLKYGENITPMHEKNFKPKSVTKGTCLSIYIQTENACFIGPKKDRGNSRIMSRPSSNLKPSRHIFGQLKGITFVYLCLCCRLGHISLVGQNFPSKSK